MIRNIYGFTDTNEKVKIGEYDDGFEYVGGRIFYIDSYSDETVEFYDAQGNVLSNVAVGDTPTYYKITNTGISGKDRYYVYHDGLIDQSYWTYIKDGVTINEDLGTNTGIGYGKSNTSLVMSSNDGEYITNTATGDGSVKPTVWYNVNFIRNNNLDNCNDWYVGSKDELEKLRVFLANNSSWLGLANYFDSYYMWSSSEYTSDRAYNWWYTGGPRWDNYLKMDNERFIPIRSF